METVNKTEVGNEVGEILTSCAESIPDFEAGVIYGMAQAFKAISPTSDATPQSCADAEEKS